MTKAEIFTKIIDRCGDDEEIVACMKNELALLAARKVKAKERADKKRAEGDELQAAILNVLTKEPQTREDILLVLEDETLTVSKIQAKLNNLVKFEYASKCTVKTEEGKNKIAYTLL